MNQTPVTKPASPDAGARLGGRRIRFLGPGLTACKALILPETLLIGYRPLTNFDGSTSQEEKKGGGEVAF